jgi:hypothetical protein
VKELFDYMKSVDANKWHNIYPYLRSAYGLAVTKQKKIRKTEPYLISFDFHYLKHRVDNNLPISTSDIKSQWWKSNLHGDLNISEIKSIIHNPVYDFYYDIMFILDLIGLEDRKERFTRRTPVISAIMSTVTALIISFVSLFFANRQINSKVDDLKYSIDLISNGLYNNHILLFPANRKIETKDSIPEVK